MKEITEGEKLKWGYGICWKNYDRRTYTITLVPFNLLLRYTRHLYFYLAKSARTKQEVIFQNEVLDSYSNGVEHGKIYGKREFMKELGKALGKGIDGMEEQIEKWVKQGYHF